jgi:hypothetical protein
MGNLLFILICLFVALWLVIKVAERYAKPLQPEQQAKLSRVLVILIFLLLLGRVLQHYLFT